MTWADAPVLFLVVAFIAVEAGYLTHRWKTVSQEYARLRGAHAAFALTTLGAVLAALLIHLGFGWEN